jgi:predicted homoserine dehydrogenase-like protein
MIYSQLFDKLAPGKVVSAAVIGTGHFATATIAQAESMRRLRIDAVADLKVEAAQAAWRKAGVPDEAVAVCESRAEALAALEKGRRVIVRDSALLLDLPLQVIVEATGVPEAGARHGRDAIAHGKHVIMANKETDCAVGPMLNKLARRAGLVYSQADGDQHGLLIQMVEWARELGLEIVCAGKARDSKFMHEPARDRVSCGRHEVLLSERDRAWLRPIPPGRAAEFVEARRRLLQGLPQLAGYDVSELVIAANSTGLPMADAALACPILHTAELPGVLLERAHGGILARGGVIEAVTSLHYPEEAHLGGGVFMVVRGATAYARHILATKGCLSSENGEFSLIYRPYHLCGVETPISILCAGLLGISTGVRETFRPRYDMAARARRPLRPGEEFPNDHSPDLQALALPARPLAEDHPVPFHLALGCRFRTEIPEGALITLDMIQPPAESVLWDLRREQDQCFA